MPVRVSWWLASQLCLIFTEQWSTSHIDKCFRIQITLSVNDRWCVMKGTGVTKKKVLTSMQLRCTHVVNKSSHFDFFVTTEAAEGRFSLETQRENFGIVVIICSDILFKTAWIHFLRELIWLRICCQFLLLNSKKIIHKCKICNPLKHTHTWTC